jgi:hypothetical protein
MLFFLESHLLSSVFLFPKNVGQFVSQASSVDVVFAREDLREREREREREAT